MKVLHLCLGLYNFWTTYEGEYFNESLMSHPDVTLRMWGRDRMFYKDGMSAIDAVKHIYGEDYPDVIIVHSTMQKHKERGDQKLLEGIETLRNHSVVVWRVFDCFKKRLPFYRDQINKYKPHYSLVWYPDQVENLQRAVGQSSKVCFFPHAVGRRYFNKNCNRPYDVALIGRCSIDPKGLPKLKVYVPPIRDTRPEKGNNLVNDLNLCRFSWNSPVEGQYASLRFVEAPACGTISAVPGHFKQLDHYFPKDCYLVCDGNPSRQIRSMSPDECLSMQERAYKVVINNHTMDRRVEYFLDLVQGKSVLPQDYYRV